MTAMSAEHDRVERRGSVAPWISVCTPQYNRTDFLLAALSSIAAQGLRPLEVCISDDASTDGGQERILAWLEASDLDYAYVRQPTNLRYDGNLRAALGLARGDYCFLLGNDDGLAEPDVLERLREAVRGAAEPPAVVVTNYACARTGKEYRRARAQALRPGSPVTAARVFRNFSFLGGVLLRRDMTERFATDRWDGSEFYQTYLACSAIASGGALLEAPDVTVRMSLEVPGQEVDSYARRPRAAGGVVERRLNLDPLLHLVDAAIAPFATSAERTRCTALAAAQLLAFTYPFWLFEYRRVQSWQYAAGVCLGLRPSVLFKDLPLGRAHRAALGVLFAAVSGLGLGVPLPCFDAARWPLYRAAKWWSSP